MNTQKTIGTIFTLVLFGTQLGAERVFHFKQRMSIQISRSSPARLALEQVQNIKEKTHLHHLSAQGEVVDLNKMIIQRQMLSGAQSIKSKKYQLKTSSFNRQDLVQWQKQEQFISSLSASERNRLLEAEERQSLPRSNSRNNQKQASSIIDEDWSVPNTNQILSEKIQEFAQREPATSFVPKTVTVAASRVVDAQTEADQKQNLRTEQEDSEPVLLNGNIEIKPGQNIAFLQGDRLNLFWTENGAAKTSGDVDLSRAKNFSIRVPKAAGLLIAQMVSDTGKVKASGRIQIEPSLSPQERANLKIQVEPRDQISGIASSFYQQTTQSGKTAPFTSAYKSYKGRLLVGALNQELALTPEGDFKIEGLKENSESLIRTEVADYYPGITRARAGEMHRLSLYPQKMIEALLAIGREIQQIDKSEQNGAVIWGQVESSFSAAGVEIELEGHPELRPIYLNDLFLPDSGLKGTTKSGYFVFLDLPAGYYSLRAMRAQQVIGFENIEVDEDTISTAKISEQFAATKIKTFVFDAFTGESQEALVAYQSLSEASVISAQAEIVNPASQKTQLVHATPSDAKYSPALYLLEKDQQELHIPLVDSRWLNQLKGYAKISDKPGTGILVGFSEQDEYEINLSHLENFDTTNVVYFNSQGLPVTTPSRGGGFIAYNVPVGVQSILYLAKKEDLPMSRLIPIDSGAVSILKLGF